MANVDVVRKNLETLGAAHLLRDVAKIHNVTEGAIIGLKRSRRVTRARHELWRLVKTRFGLSYLEMASMFDCHHSGIVQALTAHPHQ